jgi:lysophospholipase L1-like esterase
MARFRRVCAGFVTAMVACVACAVPAAASSSIAGDSYVAIGDSYAAGEGIGTTTGAPVPGCQQSAQDYPHQVAARLGLQLTDVSCSGAVTANIDTTPQRIGGGTVPLQDSALTASTDLVTVTIGGNDLGFVSIAEYCAAVSPTGPLALHPQTTCSQVYDPNGVDSLQRKLVSTVTPAITRALADIKRKAPHAKILVLDYPAISTAKADAPDPATYPSSCFSGPLKKNSFPFTATDTPYLEQMEAHLSDAVRAAAAADGVEFLDVFSQSLTHSACAGTPSPWMNGVSLNLGELNVVPGSLHPNLAGATAMADVVTAAAEQALATPPTPAASPVAVTKKAGSSSALIVVAVGAALVSAAAIAIGCGRRRSRRSTQP